MCLIALRSKSGAHIPNKVIEYNLHANPDGFGLAWRDPDDGLVWEKFGPTQHRQFVDLLKRIDKTDMEYAAHWRTGTSGPNSIDLAHPFRYEDADGTPLLLFHNGIINIKTYALESDTLAFTERVLAKLPTGWWKNSGMKYLVEQAIGWSRLLIMPFDDSNNVVINPSDWKTENGILYSTYPGPYFSTTSTSAKSASESWQTLVQDDTPLLPEKTNHTWCNMDSCTVDHEKSEPEPEIWTSGGHDVTFLTGDPSDTEDGYGSARCDVCQTEGEWFQLDGTMYIDVDHYYSQGEIEEDDDVVLRIASEVKEGV